MSGHVQNSAEPEQSLKRPIDHFSEEQARPSQPILPEDSVTKAEKIERNGVNGKAEDLDEQEPAAKRIKMEDSIETVAGNGPEGKKVDSRDKVKGIALVKTELVS
jgi:tRNA-dihydrouridine synthase 3